MKQSRYALISIFLILLIGMTLSAQTSDPKVTESTLSVPWDEFKKLIHLDENQILISMETYQKILAQTGLTTKPAYPVKDGNVILTRTEFNKLVDQMKPPKGIDVTPPFQYLITKAIYSGKMGESNTAFKGTFQIHVLKEDAFLKIPFLPQSIALEDIRIDGKQALIVSENGYHHVVLTRSGEYQVEVLFSLRSSLEKGPYRLDLPIQQTPITLLNLEIPLKDIDVEIPEASQIQSSIRGGSTVINAIAATGRTISIRWRKKVAVTEQITPKLYCEIHHLISIEDNALKINSDLNYNILHSEVYGVRISVPEDINVLNVFGEGIGEWQESNKNNERIIDIPFTYGKKGNVTVNIISEKTLSETGTVTPFTGFQTVETVRETGVIAVELNTSAEVMVPESQGLEQVAIQKIPRSLFNKSVKPLIYGFKYLKHPFYLTLDIKKHEKISVPVATVTSANIVTLFTEDGKKVHRLMYQIRNSAKQLLKITLPKDADIWSVFVGNEPVESTINENGELLVPLIRSRSVQNRLDTFPVEIIYCQVNHKFTLLSSKESALPAVDLLTSQIMWSVYLPNDYTYLHFRSTLEKEEMIRGINLLSSAGRRFNEEAAPKPAGDEVMEMDELNQVYKGKDYKSRFRNQPLKEEQLSSQIQAELGFSGRLEGLQQEIPQTAVSGGQSGILPIQIEIPTGGQVYRFARTIVKPEDPLTIRVMYVRNWIMRTVKWIIGLLALLILFLSRKRLNRMWEGLKKRFFSIQKRSKKYDYSLKKMTQSVMTPFILIGLVFLFLFVSRFLSILCLFLLWISVVYHILRLVRKSKDKKTGTPIKVKKSPAVKSK